MRWSAVSNMALRSLFGSKLRSALAALGILIGVGAVIALLSLGAGAQKDIIGRVSSLGTDLLMVRPGLRRGRHGVSSGIHQNLTIRDAEAIVAEARGVAQVSPVVTGRAQVKYFNENSNITIRGGAPTYFTIRNFEVEKGRPFTDMETNGAARVAVLGPATVEDLFGENEPLGETIKLKGIIFRVIGVLKAKGDQGWFNPDDQAIIPFTTAMDRMFGLDHLGEIDVQAAATGEVELAKREIERVLRRRHRIGEGEEDDFNVTSQAEMLEMISSVTGTFTLLLGGIAAISLLVGGIGIMNIMYVTVTERTREIGIRKAVGAKRRDILGQFLFEAVLLSGLGGAAGVIFGASLAAVLSRLMGFGVVLRPGDILLALSFSAGVGVFFGYYPARRAARLDPIDALRYE
ncbi:MAG: ABC transporter permease [Planctomycetota bacterium]